MKTYTIYSDYHTEKISMYKYLFDKGFMPSYALPKWDNAKLVIWFYKTSDELVEALNWYMIQRNIDVRFVKG